MLTQKDTDLLTSLFATKAELKQLEEKVDEGFRQVLSRFDYLFGQMNRLTEEFQGHVQHHEDEDLDKRVTKLEKHLGLA